MHSMVFQEFGKLEVQQSVRNCLGLHAHVQGFDGVNFFQYTSAIEHYFEGQSCFPVFFTLTAGLNKIIRMLDTSMRLTGNRIRSDWEGKT
jgi:hypothetical protein